MSKTIKLIWIIFVAYLLIASSFSHPVKAQTSQGTKSLSCENPEFKPNTVVYHQEPFKKVENGKSGNHYVVYVAKSQDEDVKLEVKGLDSGWSIKSADKSKISVEKISAKELLVKGNSEFQMISNGGDNEKLELKAKDFTAIVHTVEDKDDIVSVIEYLKNQALENEAEIAGLERQEYELEANIYEIALAALNEEIQKSKISGSAVLPVTGLQTLTEIAEGTLTDLANVDAKVWLSSEEVQNSVFLPSEDTVRAFIEGKITVEQYLNANRNHVSIGNRLALIYSLSDEKGFRNYVESFASQFEDKTRVRSLLTAAKIQLEGKVSTSVIGIIDEQLNKLPAEVKPTVKPVDKKPYIPPTENEIRARADEISKIRERILLDEVPDDLTLIKEEVITTPEGPVVIKTEVPIPEQQLVRYLGGEERVNRLLSERKLQLGTPEATAFMREQLGLEIRLYGPWRMENILSSSGLSKVDLEKYLDLKEDYSPKIDEVLERFDLEEARTQLQMERRLQTLDIETYRNVLTELAKENDALNQFRKLNKRASDILRSPDSYDFGKYFDMLANDDFFGVGKKSEISLLRDDLKGKVTSVDVNGQRMLAHMEEFQKLVRKEGTFLKGKTIRLARLSGQFKTDVGELSDTIKITYDRLPQEQKVQFRKFMGIVDEVTTGSFAEGLTHELTPAKAIGKGAGRDKVVDIINQEISYADEFIASLESDTPGVPKQIKHVDIIQDATRNYQDLLIKAREEFRANGIMKAETKAALVNQADNMKSLHRSLSDDLKFGRRNGKYGNYLINHLKQGNLNDPVLLKMINDLEFRLKHPTLARFKENAQKIWHNRMEAINTAVRETVSKSPNSGLYKRIPKINKLEKLGGPLGFGFVGAFVAGPGLQEYGQLTGNTYVLWIGRSLDYAAYGAIALTVIADALIISGRALPLFLRSFSIIAGGVTGLVGGFVIGFVLIEVMNVILCKLNPAISTCGCSTSPLYGKVQLQLEKTKVKQGEILKYVIYGAQYCEYAFIDFNNIGYGSAGRETKQCEFENSACCEGEIEISASPATYGVSGNVLRGTGLTDFYKSNMRTEPKQLTVTPSETGFVIFRHTLVCRDDTCFFEAENSLKENIIVKFYVKNSQFALKNNPERDKVIVKPKEQETQFEKLKVAKLKTDFNLLNSEEPDEKWKVYWAAYKESDQNNPIDFLSPEEFNPDFHEIKRESVCRNRPEKLCGAPGSHVTLFEDKEFGKAFTDIFENTVGKKDEVNSVKEISSIKLQPNYGVTLYEKYDPQYSGSCRTFFNNVFNLDDYGFNDNTDSVKVWKDGFKGATLYDHDLRNDGTPNQGERNEYYPNDGNKVSLKTSDCVWKKVSAVEVSQGSVVVLYEGDNEANLKVLHVTKATSTLPSNKKDKATYVKVCSTDACLTNEEKGLLIRVQGVYLCDDEKCLSDPPDSPWRRTTSNINSICDIAPSGTDSEPDGDKICGEIGSISIVGPYDVKLHENKNFGGKKICFRDEGAYRLDDYPITSGNGWNKDTDSVEILTDGACTNPGVTLN